MTCAAANRSYSTSDWLKGTRMSLSPCRMRKGGSSLVTWVTELALDMISELRLVVPKTSGSEASLGLGFGLSLFGAIVLRNWELVGMGQFGLQVLHR